MTPLTISLTEDFRKIMQKKIGDPNSPPAGYLAHQYNQFRCLKINGLKLLVFCGRKCETPSVYVSPSLG
jgi:hypothetical protein